MTTARLLYLAQLSLIVLLAVVHVILAGFAINADARSVVSAYLYDTILKSQVALLMTWGILGTKSWVARIAFFLPCLVMLYVLAYEDSGNVHVPQFLTLLPLLITLRIRGYLIGAPGKGQQLPRVQFSILGLIVLTSAVAIAITTVGFARRGFVIEEGKPFGFYLAGIIFALVSVAAVWFTMRLSNFWLGATGALVCALLLGFVLGYICKLEAQSSVFVVWTVTHALVIVGSLGVLRLCNLRLVKKPKKELQA